MTLTRRAYREDDDDRFAARSAPPPLQLELASDGSGGNRRTAIGLFGDRDGDGNGHSIDPTVLTNDPPPWFRFTCHGARRHFYKNFQKMPVERALQIMATAGLPPLCILVVAMKWNLLHQYDFDYFDLQTVFDGCGYDADNFTNLLKSLELRSLYKLTKVIGTRNADMLHKAPVSEFKGDD